MSVRNESLRMDRERAYLLGWTAGAEPPGQLELEMEELEELSRTAGAEVVGSDVQKRSQVDPRTFFGRGKVSELASLRRELDFRLLITNDDLSPRQQRNLEQELELRIVDRTGLILDIFAQHARSREGRIQVEVAQLRHLLPRLAGGSGLSRLGGGIGTRGPGEQKLETDRRRIRTRLRSLERALKQVGEERSLHRAGRRRVPFRTVAVVGYTNAGKSTLLNALTAGGARAENQLFATLDPTTRALRLPTDQPCLMTDTVGFIQKLPPELVAAFHATLEEVQSADLLVHVLDASHSGAELRRDTVHSTLAQLGLSEKPMILAINKVDLCSAAARHRLSGYQTAPYSSVVLVSATTGEGLLELREAIAAALAEGLEPIDVTLPYGDWEVLARWRRYGVVDRQEFTSQGVHVVGRVPPSLREALLAAVGQGSPRPATA